MSEKSDKSEKSEISDIVKKENVTKTGVRTIAPEENCPPLPPRLGLGFGLGLLLELGSGGNFPCGNLS